MRGLQEIAQAHADKPALIAGGQVLTYSELWGAAVQVAWFLASEGIGQGDRIGLLGQRTVHDFVHLLGIWLAGAAYVPLNHKFPVSRNRDICIAAGARGLLVGPHSTAVADQLPAADTPAISLPELGSSYRHLDNAPAAQVSGTPAADLAYVLFTSGTTGAPKGVPITFANLTAYLSNIGGQYPISADDRMAQLADLSFDASVHEIAWCWSTGGALCVVPASGALMWPRYAQELRVSVALLVPSSVILAARARLLGPRALPDLRFVFLGAEVLSAQVVRTIRPPRPTPRSSTCGVLLKRRWPSRTS